MKAARGEASVTMARARRRAIVAVLAWACANAIAARAPREATAPIARVMDTRAWVGSIACSQCGARFEVAATRFELYMS